MYKKQIKKELIHIHQIGKYISPYSIKTIKLQKEMNASF